MFDLMHMNNIFYSIFFLSFQVSCMSTGTSTRPPKAYDICHQARLMELGWPQSRREPRLDIDEIGTTMTIRIGDTSLSASLGVLENPQFGFSSQIKNLLRKALSHIGNNGFIIRMFEKCRAIIPGKQGNFSLFDPHSCDEFGLPDPNGKACVLHFDDVNSLVHYFGMLVQGAKDEQVDVHGVKMTILSEVASHHNKSTDETSEQCNESLNNVDSFSGDNNIAISQNSPPRDQERYVLNNNSDEDIILGSVTDATVTTHSSPTRYYDGWDEHQDSVYCSKTQHDHDNNQLNNADPSDVTIINDSNSSNSSNMSEGKELFSDLIFGGTFPFVSYLWLNCPPKHLMLSFPYSAL